MNAISNLCIISRGNMKSPRGQQYECNFQSMYNAEALDLKHAYEIYIKKNKYEQVMYDSDTNIVKQAQQVVHRI